MGFTTVGRLIKEIRTAKNITRKALSYGICSEHALRELEEDRYAADVLMLDVLLQRLGQSPDKFEMVLSSENYNMVRLRDLIAETIYRQKRKLAYGKDMPKDGVQQMFCSTIAIQEITRQA